MYYSSKDIKDDNELNCENTEETFNKSVVKEAEKLAEKTISDGIFRTFRFAVSTTEEYSKMHIDRLGLQTASDTDKKNAVLAAVVVTMNLTNAILEKEISVRLQLVDITGTIFLENDVFTNGNRSLMLEENKNITNEVIGVSNYDLGHLFNKGNSGVAYVGVACSNYYKALATSGFGSDPASVGRLRLFLHELGHSFGANHSFNNNEKNRRAPTAVEPFKGKSIMSYSRSLSYYHSINLREIFRVNAFKSCPTEQVINQPPNANAGSDYIIPYGTAFTLSGTGSDPDGGNITYSWEQNDPGLTAEKYPTPTGIGNPQFRSFSPVAIGQRTFPSLSDILNGNLAPQQEVIPNVARDLNFTLTVRDNQTINGGQVAIDDMLVKTADTGPFVVTYPNTTGETLKSGAISTISWDVAGTDNNGINTSHVNILLSTDGGQNFTTLAANTPNDGSETLNFFSQVPTTKNNCRLKIEAVDNIYFAMSVSFKIEATALNETTTWTGAIDTNWDNAGNWTNGVPTATTDVIISDLANDPVIGKNTGATTLNISTSNVLSITSGGSLIVNGNATGNITYNRELNFISGNSEGWYIVAAPVKGQVINNTFISENDIAIGTGDNRGIATYDNGITSSRWNYHQLNTNGEFAISTGYSVKRGTASGNLSFTGSINTNDVNKLISIGDGNAYNLTGNPFAAYIDNTALLTLNTNILDSETIWIWNQSKKGYDSKVSGIPFKIAPGQGFFVKSSTTEDRNLIFEKNIQSHETTDTFFKSEQIPEIQVHITDGSLNRYAKVYYINSASKGFDNGLDGETFTGIGNNFDVFTQLLEDNQGKSYQIQSLSNTDLETMVVPIGIKAKAGKEIIFSADVLNLPEGIKVFLEDRLTSKFTQLDEENSNYKVTLTDASESVGRFYLHTSQNVLNISDNNGLDIDIYVTNEKILKILGLQKEKASVKVFNILGKEIIKTSLNSGAIKDISLSKIKSGLLIVQVKTKTGILNKKIIL